MDTTLIAEPSITAPDKTEVVITAKVNLTLDQLLQVVRQLDSYGREKVAEALQDKEREMDARLDALIRYLAEKSPPNDLSEEELMALINKEVKAYRREQLAAAIDGKADAIVTGHGDMRADDALREGMRAYGVELWGITTFLDKIRERG